MSDSVSQRPPDFLRPEAGEERGQIARAELLLETHRIVGVIEQAGPPRRLVDVLNAIDGPIAIVRDAVVANLADPDEGPHRFDLLQVKRQAILLAVPLFHSPPPPGSPEAVEKRPLAATLLLPGLEVTGHVYLPPEADPGALHLLGRGDFLPVTDAELTHVTSGRRRWQEPLVVVNLGRAQLYAPAAR